MEIDYKFTDKELKNMDIILSNEDIKWSEFEHGVYNCVITLKQVTEDGKERVIGEVLWLFLSGKILETSNEIIDAADSISSDLYHATKSLFSLFNIDPKNSIGIIDYFYLYSSKLTAASRDYIYLEYILPYLQDRQLDVLGFYNSAIWLTDDKKKQSELSSKIKNWPMIFSKKTQGDDWKTILNMVNVNFLDSVPDIDEFLMDEFEREIDKELPDNFDEQYDNHLFDDDKSKSKSNVFSLIDQYYNFKRNQYFLSSGKRVFLSKKDKTFMQDFISIEEQFDNIKNKFESVRNAYDILIKVSLDESYFENSNTLTSSFISSAKMFIDFLDEKWFNVQGKYNKNIKRFHKPWDIVRQYVYEHSLGYRLCYNLRDIDQHPKNHAGQQIIKDETIDINEFDQSRLEYEINTDFIFTDNIFAKKMQKKDHRIIDNDNYFLHFARQYMFNLTILYKIALGSFITAHISKIQSIYNYLVFHGYVEKIYSSLDNKHLRRMGFGQPEDIVTTIDIDDWLEKLKNMDLLTKMDIAEVRNSDITPSKNVDISDDQIIRNIVFRQNLDI